MRVPSDREPARTRGRYVSVTRASAIDSAPDAPRRAPDKRRDNRAGRRAPGSARGRARRSEVAADARPAATLERRAFYFTRL